MMYYFFNNKIYTNDQLVISNESKAFRYGALVFETMKWANGKMNFFDAHMERLAAAAVAINLVIPKLFTPPIILQHIKKIIDKNCLQTARVRLTVFNGNGGLFDAADDTFNVLIETYHLENNNYQLNENGLDLCCYQEITKPHNKLSAFKTGNHLLYLLAAQYAKQQKCNEAIIFNEKGSVSETTISNIFIVINNQIITPSITDGCIDGIFRKKFISILPNVIEQTITKEMLLKADAVFLTNTIKGIQWVKKIDDATFDFANINTIANQLIIKINNIS